ncbi:phosphoserine phosphatase [soil metagenome]
MTARFRSVVFDCDSTLVRIEGIDELAGDLRPEIQRLTDLAMEGRVPLEEVYGRRLALIKPTRQRVEQIGRAYVEGLVDDARETIMELLRIGVDVRVISGGLLPAVLTVAGELGLGPHRVRAVDIMFDEQGAYSHFEADSPLARSGGKLEVLRSWDLPRPALMVGDGATDLEARPAVDAFVAFMGVVDRPAVAAGADHVVRTPSLAPILEIVKGRSGFGQTPQRPVSR